MDPRNDMVQDRDAGMYDADEDRDGYERYEARQDLRKWGIVGGYLLEWARELGDENVLDGIEESEAA